VEYGILGPLEVSESGRRVVIGGGKQRALLAILLLHRNEVVSIDRLIEWLWRGEPPATAAKIVQLYVSQLRKALGSEELVTQPPGYVLRVQPGQLDADRFEHLLTEARRALADGAAQEASEQLRDADGLWRGHPLSDFSYEDFAQQEIGRLEELRLAALEERVEADLALGRHADLVAELEALVARHPLRERLRAQLMLALYRCGRQAEALDAYQEARRMLDQELGLEPGQALQDVQRGILRHDPALEPPPRVEPLVRARIAAVIPPLLRRRSAALLVAGGILLGGSAAATIVGLTGGSSKRSPVQNAVGAIDERTGRVLSYTEVGTSPSNVAVGEGSVWVLNADDQTISQIDAETRRIVKSFSVGETPTDIAVGEGAVWLGNGAATPPGTIGDVYTASVSRIDPKSGLVTRTLQLPGPFRELPSKTPYSPPHLAGVAQLAVGAGAVWMINPDRTVSRIDPATGALAAHVDVVATHAIAAGREGVWVVGNGPTLTRIDPRTNRTGQTIELGASGLAGIAVGAGAVWAADPIDGVVWRIEPGRNPVTRSIDVGPGVTGIVFVDGTVWASDFIDGSVVRIDPGTNAVTLRTAVAATPQGIAAGAGSVWVSVAGGRNQGSLPSAACSAIASGAQGRPDLLIASDLPLQGPQRAVTRAMADAIGFVLRQHGFRAGRYTIGYQSCDDSTAQTSAADFYKCASNAKAFAETPALVGVIGPYDSSCASVEIPITNRAASGPPALISPSNTRTGLTRSGPETGRGEPASHYPTGIRNYVRLAAPSDLFGAGTAVFARRLGLHRVYVLKTGVSSYGIELSRSFVTAARRLGLTVAGSGVWDPKAASYDALAAGIARTGADGVFLADYDLNGGALIKTLRARLGRGTPLVVSDGFTPVSDVLKHAGRAALGTYVMFPVAPVERLGPAGQRFVAAFRATQSGGVVESGTYVPEAAQAAEVLLQAIATSDGTRASVLDHLRGLEVRDGILGTFRFDTRGDMTPELIAAFRITGRTPPGSTLVSDFRGAVVDRLIRVPTSLLPRPAAAG
jgi:DNA-binding SARP family transcriptional activator/ABC-type branched-subunit amino acid transport system substrate-binding protein